jgi:hypothetical protein
MSSGFDPSVTVSVRARRTSGVTHVLRVAAVALAFAVLAWTEASHAQTSVLFVEGFEDGSFSGRGWYDGTGAVLSTAEKYAGTRSLECRFAAGSTKCPSPSRHMFAASNSVYLSYYVKHSANWVGSGRAYHPHLFNFVTNLEGAYVGPAYTYLTTYVEENAGVPVLAIQDARNIDESRIGQDLTDVTEQRAVAGCNGDSDGHGPGDCYPAGSVHYNGKAWKAGAVYFGDTPGSSTYKGDWHLVEAYYQLNSVVGGKGINDGVIRYWYDGALIIDQSDVVLRTGAHPSMQFNQFLLLPFIGDGSPVDQTIWIDEITVATGRPNPPPPPPQHARTAPAAPLNVRIVK